MKRLVVIPLALSLTACAATVTNDYTQPKDYSLQNTVEINEPFDAVWDRLIKNLSEDFFVINNVEKASRIINVSFSSQNPTQWADCGMSSRSFSNIQGKQYYSYETAGPATYATTVNGIAFNVQRSAKIEGRSNIYVAQKDAKTTTVSVNTKYVINIRQAFQNFAGQPAGVQDSGVDFTTKEPGFGASTPGLSQVKCVATGALEKKVLDYTRR